MSELENVRAWAIQSEFKTIWARMREDRRVGASYSEFQEPVLSAAAGAACAADAAELGGHIVAGISELCSTRQRCILVDAQSQGGFDSRDGVVASGRHIVDVRGPHLGLRLHGV